MQNKQSDRVKLWRERQRAEGKMSFTVLLSREAREILLREKDKTGGSYADIIEKALQELNKTEHSLGTPKKSSTLITITQGRDLRHREVSTVFAAEVKSSSQPKMLIDDFANYPMQTEKETDGIYQPPSSKGIFARLLEASSGSFSLTRRRR